MQHVYVVSEHSEIDFRMIGHMMKKLLKFEILMNSLKKVWGKSEKGLVGSSSISFADIIVFIAFFIVDSSTTLKLFLIANIRADCWLTPAK